MHRFEIFAFEKYRDLETRVRGHSGHWKWRHSVDRRIRTVFGDCT